jgi:hypothetical protein
MFEYSEFQLHRSAMMKPPLGKTVLMITVLSVPSKYVLCTVVRRIILKPNEYMLWLSRLILARIVNSREKKKLKEFKIYKNQNATSLSELRLLCFLLVVRPDFRSCKLAFSQNDHQYSQ